MTAFHVAAMSYGAAAAGFVLLAVLIAASWRGRVQGALLGVSAVASFVWAATLAYFFIRSPGDARVASIVEILRTAAWLAFLVSLLDFSGRASGLPAARLHWLRLGLGLVCVTLLVVAATLPWFAQYQTQAIFLSGILGPIILAVTGMALVEQVYRNAPSEQRWGIKFLCLGVGGMFAYDFYLYSDALLFKHIDTDILAARGFVNALVVPLVAVSAARNPGWSLDISVSRQLIFHSATLLGAGVYLLLMAAAGYYIRYVGGTWGGVFQTTFLFAALLFLMLMLVSGTLRSRFKVQLSKHFFTYKFDYRTEWLRFTRTLSQGEPGLRLRERSIEAIAQLVESPGGALWLVDEKGLFERAAHWNLPSAQGSEPTNSAFVRFMEERQWVINVEEVQREQKKYGQLAIPSWLTSLERAWLVVPLTLHDRLLGFVVLVVRAVRFRLTGKLATC